MRWDNEVGERTSSPGGRGLAPISALGGLGVGDVLVRLRLEAGFSQASEDHLGDLVGSEPSLRCRRHAAAVQDEQRMRLQVPQVVFAVALFGQETEGVLRSARQIEVGLSPRIETDVDAILRAHDDRLGSETHLAFIEELFGDEARNALIVLGHFVDDGHQAIVGGDIPEAALGLTSLSSILLGLFDTFDHVRPETDGAIEIRDRIVLVAFELGPVREDCQVLTDREIFTAEVREAHVSIRMKGLEVGPSRREVVCKGLFALRLLYRRLGRDGDLVEFDPGVDHLDRLSDDLAFPIREYRVDFAQKPCQHVTLADFERAGIVVEVGELDDCLFPNGEGILREMRQRTSALNVHVGGESCGAAEAILVVLVTAEVDDREFTRAPLLHLQVADRLVPRVNLKVPVAGPVLEYRAASNVVEGRLPMADGHGVVEGGLGGNDLNREVLGHDVLLYRGIPGTQCGGGEKGKTLHILFENVTHHSIRKIHPCQGMVYKKFLYLFWLIIAFYFV